ncbi:MAG: hypothetical protein IPK53_14695 [bacterium]|nr:hypothetical protein [bacterium]
MEMFFKVARLKYDGSKKYFAEWETEEFSNLAISRMGSQIRAWLRLVRGRVLQSIGDWNLANLNNRNARHSRKMN